MNRRDMIRNTAIGGIAVGSLSLEACNAQSWIATALNDLPTILQIVTSILSIIGAATGKATAQAVAIATDAANKAKAALTEAQQFIAQYQANASTTLLGQIDDALNTAQSQLGGILATLGITDPTYQAIISAAIGSALTVIVGVQSLIPPPTTAASTRLALYRATKGTNQSVVIKTAYNESLAAANGAQFRVQ